MSPLPANDLRVVLSARQVLAARPGWSWSRGRPRRRLHAPVAIPLQAAGPGIAAWRPALDTLEPLLREQAKRTRVHVTISNSLVRYALVPSQPGLGGDAQDAYVRDWFGQLYGDAAANWDIRTVPGALRVASAIDGELVGELAAACERAGLALASARPLFASVVNRWRGALRVGCFWLVLAEPGTLCVALAAQRQWRALLTARAGDDWLPGLATLLERETLLSGVQADVEKVFMWAPQLDADAPQAIGNWPVTRLSAGAFAGAVSPTAAWFGVGE